MNTLSAVNEFMNNFLKVASSAQLTYNSACAVLETPKFQSLAGNIYFNGLRIAGNVIIKEDTGIGYARKFLNGISVFIDGKEIEHFNYTSNLYSLSQIKETIEKILLNHLILQFVNQGIIVIDTIQLKRAVQTIVNNLTDNQEQLRTYSQIEEYRKELGVSKTILKGRIISTSLN
jgi:hypothetical protein